MHAWHYVLVVRGTICSETAETEEKAREEIQWNHGKTAEIKAIRRAGSDERSESEGRGIRSR